MAWVSIARCGRQVAICRDCGPDGKTTTAVHLAVMLAGQGRTLLIDGDPLASAAS